MICGTSLTFAGAKVPLLSVAEARAAGMRPLTTAISLSQEEHLIHSIVGSLQRGRIRIALTRCRGKGNTDSVSVWRTGMAGRSKGGNWSDEEERRAS